MNNSEHFEIRKRQGLQPIRVKLDLTFWDAGARRRQALRSGFFSLRLGAAPPRQGGYNDCKTVGQVIKFVPLFVCF